ncbi:hypothetical protein VCR17J2_90014 [Vibrio coralliirubri]|nr:hypothetical protein VCR17J2_90014 [Vibrio coralliirubri]
MCDRIDAFKQELHRKAISERTA